MSENKFRNTTIIVLALLIAGNAILALLNFSTVLKVRDISINDEKTELVELEQKKITIEFNTPLKKSQSLSQKIKINPETNFSINQSKNIVTLNPKEPLKEMTEYEVNVSKDVIDIYDRTLEDTVSYNFTTRPYNIVFMQKNFPNGNDKIISINLQTKQKKILYEHIQILNFAKKGKYMAVVTKDPLRTPSLIIVNTLTKETDDIENKKQAFYSMNFDNGGNLYYIYADNSPHKNRQLNESKLVKYSMVSKQKQELNLATTNSEDIFIEEQLSITGIQNNAITNLVTEFIFSKDYKHILFKNSAGNFYYLAKTKNLTETTPIGTFAISRGLNGNSTKAIFIDLDENAKPTTFVYDLTNGVKSRIAPYEKTIDGIFFSTKDNIALSVSYEKGRQKDYYNVKVMEPNEDGQYSSVTEIHKDGLSLEIPIPSPSDRYLLLEGYDINNINLENSLRGLRPNEAAILIYDLEKNEFLDIDAKGIMAMWE